MPTEQVQAQRVTRFTTPAEVNSAFLGSESFWNARNVRIQLWRNLVKQIDYRQRKQGATGKYHSFEGNESASFYSAMVQLLTKNPIRSRIPLAQTAEADRKVAGQVERLIEGTYRDIDDRRARRPLDAEPLRSTIAKFACADGWAITETVKLEEDDAAEVDVRTYDITDVAFDWAQDGLTYAILRSQRTQYQLRLEYPNIDTTKVKGPPPRVGLYDQNAPQSPFNIPVYTCYWRLRNGDKFEVWYGSAVNEQWAIEPYKLAWTTQVPVCIVPMNGLPFRNNLGYVTSKTTRDEIDGVDAVVDETDDWTSDVGRGIFHMNETLYEEMNRLWADVLDFLDKESHNTWFKETDEGDDDELGIGRGGDVVNALKTGEKIGRVPPGSMANELSVMLNSMASMLQRGGISWQLMGQLPAVEFSGFAINQLLSAAVAVANPYIIGVTTLYRQTNAFIVEAYKHARHDFTEVNVWREKTLVQERIDLKVLEGRKFWFEVQLRPGLPNDLAVRMNTAALARRDGLLDKWTIMDEILDQDDPEQIIARQNEEQILERPTIKLRLLITQMLREGRRDEAMALLLELRMVESTMQVQQGALDAQLAQFERAVNPGAGAATSMETGMGGAGPGGRAPEASPIMSAGRGGRMPPEVLPPELGGVSPASLRMADMLGNIM